MNHHPRAAICERKAPSGMLFVLNVIVDASTREYGLYESYVLRPPWFVYADDFRIRGHDLRLGYS